MWHPSLTLGVLLLPARKCFRTFVRVYAHPVPAGPETGIVTGLVTDAQDTGLPGVLVTLTGTRRAKR